MMMEKQIEEIARDICGFSQGQTCIIDNKKCDMACTYARVAEKITAKDYRKVSEVAEEIFAKIEEMLEIQEMIVCETRERSINTDEPMLSFVAMLDGRIYSLHVVEEHVAELKKKYAESEDTE